MSLILRDFFSTVPYRLSLNKQKTCIYMFVAFKKRAMISSAVEMMCTKIMLLRYVGGRVHVTSKTETVAPRRNRSRLKLFFFSFPLYIRTLRMPNSLPYMGMEKQDGICGTQRTCTTTRVWQCNISKSRKIMVYHVWGAKKL